MLKPLKHARELYDWRPEFDLSMASFDSRNRPYIRSRAEDRHVTRFVHTLRNGKWVEREFIDDIKRAFPGLMRTLVGGGFGGRPIVFDADDHAYTSVQFELEDGETKTALLYSRDYCKTWQVHELPKGAWMIQCSNTPRPLPRPPAIYIKNRRKEHPAKWCAYNDFDVQFLTKTGRALDLGKPVRVSSDMCCGPSAVTLDGKTHVVWGDATDQDLPGVPTYVATYDHETGRLGPKVLLAHAPPVNDGHNGSQITVDSEGFLHVVTGAHGANFYYLKSKKPNDAYSGWTDPVPTLTTGRIRKGKEEKGQQTYVALAIDCDDTLHLAFRQWRQRVDDYFPHTYYGALSYQRKKKHGQWDKKARPLVIPPVFLYSHYYQRLAVDRKGRLFLNHGYYSDRPQYKDIPANRFRAMLFSADGGDTWDLAVTRDFEEGCMR